MLNLKTLALACTTLLPTAALADWNGYYIGGSAGSVTDNTFDFTSGGTANIGLEDTTSLGGFVGFRTQSGQLVYGGEIEVSYMPEITGTTVIDTVDGPAAVTVAHTELTVDLKARAGIAVGRYVLAYGVLGLSTYSFDNNMISDAFEQSGFSVGAGVDFLATDNLFIGVEYLSRFPSGEVEVIGFDGTIEHESQVNSIGVRAGLKF